MTKLTRKNKSDRPDTYEYLGPDELVPQRIRALRLNKRNAERVARVLRRGKGIITEVTYLDGGIPHLTFHNVPGVTEAYNGDIVGYTQQYDLIVIESQFVGKLWRRPSRKG